MGHAGIQRLAEPLLEFIRRLVEKGTLLCGIEDLDHRLTPHKLAQKFQKNAVQLYVYGVREGTVVGDGLHVTSGIAVIVGRDVDRAARKGPKVDEAEERVAAENEFEDSGLGAVELAGEDFKLGFVARYQGGI